MIKTDALIIGAGPTGLFTAHQLKLIGLDCEIVDNLDKIGGQCIELYPDKPIYDIPAVPECTGEELTNNLINQINELHIHNIRLFKGNALQLLDELKKITHLEILEKLADDKLSSELFLIVFPELNNLKTFSKLNSKKKQIINKADFVFLLSLMIIDETDNADYFMYKFNISKKDQKRIKIIDNFFKEKIGSKTFREENFNGIFYYNGKQAVTDILNYYLIKSKKNSENIQRLINFYKDKTIPKMPVGAEFLMEKFNIPKGKQLGAKLKIIEEEWVKNNFQISDKQVSQIVNN